MQKKARKKVWFSDETIENTVDSLVINVNSSDSDSSNQGIFRYYCRYIRKANVFQFEIKMEKHHSAYFYFYCYV